MELSKTDQKIADKIADIRNEVQAYMNANITSYEGRMTSGKIYEGMGLTNIDQKDFQLGLSMCIKKGIISGFRGVKGKYGGYCPIDGEDNQESTNRRIDLGNGVSLVSYDQFNWCLEGLGVKRYWPTLEQACVGAAGIMMEAQLKSSIDGGTSLENLPFVVSEAKTAIIKQLQSVVVS